jgi:DNA-binding CsgD family transcriptional regulator
MELVARERELATLDELLDAGRQGRGGALVLRGELGVGLSTLLEHVVASASDMRIARSVGVESERDLAFAGAHQLCASMLDHLEELPDVQRDELASAFGLTAEHVPDRFLVGAAVLTLFSKVTQERPLLCVVDDAQWLHPASAEAVAFVARRLGGAGVCVVVGLHEPGGRPDLFAGIPELFVEGLSEDAARELLGSLVPGPLDARVRDRIVATAQGIPLALVELSAQLTAEQLAGLSGLPAALPVGDRLEERLLGPIRTMPEETRQLLLLAAADREGSTSLLWSAAAQLGISAEAAAPAEAGSMLRLGRRVAFRHPLVPLAIYQAAPVAERRRVHQALAEAVDPAVDPDLRAWHRAAASLASDEAVAVELEASAGRATGRRDYATAVTLMERAASLTPDPNNRYERTLAAAQAALAAGAPGRAVVLLDQAFPRPADDLQRAEAERLRGAIGLALGSRADRPTMLLEAAGALAALDGRLARDTYLEALEAAAHTGGLGSEGALLRTAEAARSAPVVPESQQGSADLLLDGLALLVTVGHKAGVPTVRRALESLRYTDELRWLALGSLAAAEIWDDEALHDLTNRRAELARGTEPLDALPLGLGEMDDVVAGQFGTATAPFAEVPELGEARLDPCVGRLISPADLIASAWRGRSTEAQDLAEACMREAFARQLGLYVAVAHHAIAVLEIGLGRYEAALTAAREVGDEPALFVVTSTLPELIEAAVRTGERGLAVSAVGRLAERARPSGTDWALGTLARSRALLEEGSRAEKLYRKAIEHLRRSRAAPQLARSHLVYGEWLRRERRRREAREQLRTARDMFIFMGAQAFAERARIELTATGEQPRRRVTEASPDTLTAQEARIAQLVGGGASNAEVAAQLYLSPRTVEYHLHKIFRRLGVSSRTQLARALLESQDTETPDLRP